jgi:tetratricopeptide (TPR) repeat protein
MALACLLSFLAIVPHGLFATPVNFWFDRANALYEQQAYDSAAVYYEKIIASGMNNSAVYFNAGNSYFRLKKIGPAILNFERAHLLSPDDPDIIANLRFANSSIIDRLPQQQESFIGAMMVRAHTMLSLSTQLWVLLALLFIVSGCIIAIIYIGQSNFRLWLIYLSSILFIASIFLGTSAGIKIYTKENVSYAIVLSPALDAKNQPNGNKVLFTVHEGIKFRIRKTINDWALVSLPTGVSGWVQTSSLGRI